MGGDQTQEGFNNKYTLPQHNNTEAPMHMLFLALLCPKIKKKNKKKINIYMSIFILENEVEQFQF
jgi:hypothetical protein